MFVPFDSVQGLHVPNTISKSALFICRKMYCSSYFFTKCILWILVRTALSTHNLCFGAEKKQCITLQTPRFAILSEVYRRIHGPDLSFWWLKSVVENCKGLLIRKVNRGTILYFSGCFIVQTKFHKKVSLKLLSRYRADTNIWPI